MERADEKHSYCEHHIGLIEKVVSMHTSIQNIEKGICEDQGFKRGVFLAFLGIMITLAVQIASFSYLFGQASRQIMINTARLDVIENRLFIKQ